jgi:hypothetical protein
LKVKEIANLKFSYLQKKLLVLLAANYCFLNDGNRLKINYKENLNQNVPKTKDKKQVGLHSCKKQLSVIISPWRQTAIQIAERNSWGLKALGVSSN